jgi:hypothetical protein
LTLEVCQPVLCRNKLTPKLFFDDTRLLESRFNVIFGSNGIAELALTLFEILLELGLCGRRSHTSTTKSATLVLFVAANSLLQLPVT